MSRPAKLPLGPGRATSPPPPSSPPAGPLLRRLVDLPALLAERGALVARLAEIDAELARQGVRTIGAPMVRRRDVFARVVEAMAIGPASASDVAKYTGQKLGAAYQYLSMLAKAGDVVRLGHGLYGLPKGAAGSREEPRS